MSKETHYNFAIVVEYDKNGYFASCPGLQGCYSQGKTYEEALANIRDAITLHVEDRLESGEEVPREHFVSIAAINVAVAA